MSLAEEPDDADGVFSGTNRNSKVSSDFLSPKNPDVSSVIGCIVMTLGLFNLVINGLQAAPQRHRVEVRAQMLDRSLNLQDFHESPQDLLINQDGFRNKPPLLALSVQDNGPGIPPEVLPHIFDPYFTTRQRGQNVGLGLTIVQRFVRQAAGAIHVHTQVDRGTILTIYLGLRNTPSTLELGV